MSYLKSAKTNQKKLGFSLSKELVEDYLALQKEAKAKGFIFDLTDQVAKDVQEAVRSVRRELEEKKEEKPEETVAQS